jgi:hypothetical protein
MFRTGRHRAGRQALLTTSALSLMCARNTRPLQSHRARRQGHTSIRGSLRTALCSLQLPHYKYRRKAAARWRRKRKVLGRRQPRPGLGTPKATVAEVCFQNPSNHYSRPVCCCGRDKEGARSHWDKNDVVEKRGGICLVVFPESLKTVSTIMNSAG